MQIRAVIFDFGGVVSFHPTQDQIAVAAQACGLTPQEFLRVFWANRVAYDRGEDPQVYWRGVASLAGRTFDDALMAQLIEYEIEFWSNYDQRVLAWADELRARDVRAGILSNMPQPLGRRLRATKEFLKHFEHLTFSFELRCVKPDAAIYEHAVRGLGVPPEQALFLDDRQENVEGARAAGLHAELFVSWESFLEDTPARYGLPAPTVARRQ